MMCFKGGILMVTGDEANAWFIQSAPDETLLAWHADDSFTPKFRELVWTEMDKRGLTGAKVLCE